MAGNFGAASWMDEGSLARVAGVVGAGFCHFPGAVEMSWGRWWWMSSPPAWWVAAGVVCLRCVDAVSWCVNCAAGPAALSSCCLLSLSRCIRCTPSLSLLFHSFSFWLTDQLTDSSDSTTGDDDCDDDDGDGAAPCGVCRVVPYALVLLLGFLDMCLVMRMRWLCRWMCRVLRVTAARAIACVGLCGRGRSVLLPVLRLSMRIILSVALMCACMAGMVSWVLCAMWPMRCTHVATVLPAVQRKGKGPPLPSR
ncbi:hypothetical protein ECC02_008245 [Trypanosoma cruzi]|uniref:Uncharacterized protein n=1 Tax=Trypanosoma cruzi TaxID=5693 RepID=A0A7J6XWX8_TRYCR|nr:hypothetical protein ECC02_008245 [Trypanosoma cruzi]